VGAAVSKRAAFTQDDIARALKGAKAADVKAAIVIRPDGTLLIMPSNDAVVQDLAGDLDARMEAFVGGRRR